MKKLNIGIFKVLSLAVGLAVGLVLIAKISFESSYDKFYPEYKDTYCIMQEYTNANEGSEGSDTYGQTPGAVAYYMGQEIPQVKYATRVTGIGIGTCNVFDQEQHKYTAENIILADTNYFKVFPRPFLTGDPVEVLSTWNKAMVSRTFAEKFGGVDQAVGKIFFLELFYALVIISSEVIGSGSEREIPYADIRRVSAILPCVSELFKVSRRTHQLRNGHCGDFSFPGFRHPLKSSFEVS